MRFKIGRDTTMAENRSFFRRKKRTLIVLGVILVIALIILFNLRTQREKTVKVTIEKVKASDLTSIISASGEIKPKKNVNISAHVPGRIIKIGIKEGDVVKAGGFPAEARRHSIRSHRRGKPGRHPVQQSPAHPGGGPAPEGQERLRSAEEAL